MSRLFISWKSAVAATFFVSVIGLNLSLAQPAGDIHARKGSANFQTIDYGTPKQTSTHSSTNPQVSNGPQGVREGIPQTINPPKTSLTTNPSPVPPPSCQPCGFRKVSTLEPDSTMCPMHMCAAE